MSLPHRNPLGAKPSVHEISPRDNTLDSTFASLPLKDYLDIDSRPTFVLDEQSHDALSIVYTNPSMRTTRCYQSLSAQTQLGQDVEHDLDAFYRWAVDDTSFTHNVFQGIRWARLQLRSRYTIVTGEAPCVDTGEVNISTDTKDVDYMANRRTHSSVHSAPQQSPFATEAGKPPLLRSLSTTSQFIEFFEKRDWASSPLGSIAGWSDAIRSAVRLLLHDPRPAALAIGPDNVFIWNEPYIPIVGLRHPAKFGHRFVEVFPEIPEFSDSIRSVAETGKAIHQDHAEFTLTRNGFAEESFFDFNLVPWYDNAGDVVAVFNPVQDVTNVKVAERRFSLLIQASMSTAASKSVEGYWSQLLHVLKGNRHDFPFVSVYVTAQDDAAETESMSSISTGTSAEPIERRVFHLLESVNIPEGHPAAAPVITLGDELGITPHFLRAAGGNTPVPLHSTDGSLPPELAQGLNAFVNEQVRSMVILPIKPLQETENISGFVLLGINPRRPYDQDTAIFLQIVSRLISSNLASAVLIEEEVHRAHLAAERAASEQRKLEEELKYQTQHAKSLKMRFTEFAAKAPISIFIMDADGRIVYANDLWHTYTGIRHDDNTLLSTPMGFMAVLDMTQLKDVEGMWSKLTVDHQTISYETRMLKAFTLNGTEDLSREPPWIICHAFPEVNENGEIENIVGCFTDITSTKKAELLQQKRTEEALAAKKLQEAFVDITSHELRNPMSVVLMSCEAIMSSLESDSNTPLDTQALDSEAIPSCLESARTIMHCITHQKRIVDDILTLSKLDSDLLPVAPVRTNVLETVHAVLSMFTAELKTADISFALLLTESFKSAGVHDVLVDPARLSQIFLNLMTNAIKFTQTESTRIISVRVAASETRPTVSSTGVVYVPSKRSLEDDLTTGADWGTGPPIYLMFSVTDSGRGLTDQEAAVLFQRFTQASPKTHINYGGSGLGLYICRELAEKQNGQIGVTSVAGKGSTFAFYVKARRVIAPQVQALSDRTAMMPSNFSMKLSADGEDAVMMDVPNNTRLQERKTKDTKLDTRKHPVLIVEDNIVNRRVLKKQLTRLGFPIYEAGHGEEALAFLQETKYWAGREADGKDLSIMLLDWEMPVMDGLTCIRRVRELEAQGVITGHVRTIGVTANARKEQVDTALEAGMDGIVSKPFTTADLVAQMEKWILREGMT